MVKDLTDNEEFQRLKERIYRKYGCGIDRRLFESLLLHDAFDPDQDSFRGRNDDGSETSATFIAAVNTNWTQLVDTNFRVRFLIEEEGNLQGTMNGVLQYDLAAAGFLNVTASSSVVQAVASPNFADGVATTQQVGGGTFTAGSMDEVDGDVSDITLPALNETEVEYCIQIIGADVSDAQTLQLRVIGRNSPTTVLKTYTNTPTITVDKPVGGGISVPLAFDHLAMGHHS